jgi:hypothetical protein
VQIYVGAIRRVLVSGCGDGPAVAQILRGGRSGYLLRLGERRLTALEDRAGAVLALGWPGVGNLVAELGAERVAADSGRADLRSPFAVYLLLHELAAPARR